MAFTNRLLLVVPSFGTPIQNDTLFLKAGTAIASGSTTTTLAGLTPAIRDGWIRVKIYGGTAGSTFTSMVITVTDATTTELIYSNTAVATNNSVVSPNQADFTIPFLSELAVTSVSVIIVLGTAAAVVDIEIGASN